MYQLLRVQLEASNNRTGRCAPAQATGKNKLLIQKNRQALKELQ
jgi:hypothetical protein